MSGVRAWVEAELEGRGTIGPRDDAEPADAFREVVGRLPWLAADVRSALAEALIERFDRADANGACPEADLVPLSMAARALEWFPVPGVYLWLVRGLAVDWARASVPWAAPHPLRQSFARALIALGTLPEEVLSAIRSDPELRGLLPSTVPAR